ncbi:MAG: hypothetical protein M3M97_07095 [Actinomycetota bacterium]|nr:hypothetical protein [Actinomycetota bacterium]
MRVIIVEAGLSGLTCAKVLRERGAAFQALDGSVLSGERATREVFG